MSVSASATGLLAVINRFESLHGLRKGFVKECAETNTCAWLTAAATLTVLLLLFRLIRRRRTRGTARIDYLAAAARVLRLGQSELRDLRSLAERARLPHPASLLLSPANLAYAVQAADLGGDVLGVHRRMDRLAERIFGTPLPAIEPTDEPAEPSAV